MLLVKSVTLALYHCFMYKGNFATPLLMFLPECNANSFINSRLFYYEIRECDLQQPD